MNNAIDINSILLYVAFKKDINSCASCVCVIV